MKLYERLTLVGAIIICMLIVYSFESTRQSAVVAQVWDVNYIWQEQYSVTTDSVLVLFSVYWRQASLRANNCDVLVKLAGTAESDTSDTGKKDWIAIQNGGVISVEPATGLRHMKYKASSGSGTLDIIGYKQTAQY